MGARLIVVTGPPGAGKTTVSRLVCQAATFSVHLEGDAFWEVIRRGWIPPWEPASRHQNHVAIDALAAAAGRYASGGYETVVDGIIGPWMLDRFLVGLGEPRPEVHYVILRPQRNAARTRAVDRGGGALVDPVPVDTMFEQFSDLGPFESHVVDSTDLDAAATAALVLDLVASGVTTVGQERALR